MTSGEKIWSVIYERKLPGSVLSYPCSSLISIFNQNKGKFDTNTCFDNGFGSGNNTEYLLKEFDTVYGNEVCQENINIINRRLGGYQNYNASRFFIGGDFSGFKNFFDVVVSWGVLGYDNEKGVELAIEKLTGCLKTNGVIFATIPSPGDLKTIFAKRISPNEYEIDSRIPHQEGCKVYSPDSIERFLALFRSFDIIDHGGFNRESYSKCINFSELYIVASKK